MITLKEYEIYLKVKAFIEAEGCDEADLIPKLVNGIGIIPPYVPLIIESDDTETIKYYSLSAAARGCRVSKQMIVYAYRNRKTRIGGKKESRLLGSSGWIYAKVGLLLANVLRSQVPYREYKMGVLVETTCFRPPQVK